MPKKWKTEKWSETDYVIDHETLGLRELIIVGAAELDAALADALSRRLNGTEEEIIGFLGTDESALAPCSNFGSRIDLAKLLCIINERDAAILRSIKRLRNSMAHRANLNHSSERTQKELRSLLTEAFEGHLTGTTDKALNNERHAKMIFMLLIHSFRIGFMVAIDDVKRVNTMKYEGVLSAFKNKYKNSWAPGVIARIAKMEDSEESPG